MRISTACRRRLLAATLVMGLALTLAAPPARADQVSGTVTLDGRPASNATLVVRSQANGRVTEVPVGDRGYYRVYLEPGRYGVSLKGGPPQVLVIESRPAPVTQDLLFGRR